MTGILPIPESASAAALSGVIAGFTGPALALSQYGAGNSANRAEGNLVNPDQVVVGTSVVDYADLPPHLLPGKGDPPLKPLQYFTAATDVDPGPTPHSAQPHDESRGRGTAAEMRSHETRPATSSARPHPSGWSVNLLLDHQGRQGHGSEDCWRSGEVLSGLIQLEPIQDERQKAISSVIVRLYCQSNTTYTAYRFVTNQPASTGFISKIKTSGAGGIQAISDIKGEWHRAYAEGGSGREIWHGGELESIQREVEGDFPLLEGERAALPVIPVAAPDASQSLPFAFNLPTTVQISTSNAVPANIPGRRELQLFKRTPPASLPGSENGYVAVEWIVEVLVRFQDLDSSAPTIGESSTDENDEMPPTPTEIADELPDFRSATHDPASKLSTFGFLSSTPNLLVHRVVFPFEPSDHHAQDLYSAWRPSLTGAWGGQVARYNGMTLDEIHDDRPITEGVVPQFGRDARDEALGGSNMGQKRAMKGKLVGQLGGPDMWSSFEKRMAIKSKLGRSWGWIRLESSVPRPATIARHARWLPILLHFSYTPPKEDSVVSSARTLEVSQVIITLSRRMLTRSGREERAKFHIDEMRREVVDLYDDELQPGKNTITPISTRENVLARSRTMPASAPKRKGLTLELGKEGVDVKINFDLQSEGIASNGSVFVPGKDMYLSTRMPNVEIEYILSATIMPVGQPSCYAIRVPIQVIRGDLDEAPPFPAGESPPSSVNFVAAQVPPPIENSAALPAYDDLVR